jgi:hypothetical protein
MSPGTDAAPLPAEPVAESAACKLVRLERQHGPIRAAWVGLHEPGRSASPAVVYTLPAGNELAQLGLINE